MPPDTTLMLVTWEPTFASAIVPSSSSPRFASQAFSTAKPAMSTTWAVYPASAITWT